jgi:3-dehydroquinate dehydratase-2
LGKREPGVYGQNTLEWINTALESEGTTLGLKIDARQSNHEGVLIDQLQAAENQYNGVVFNPGGYTNTSVAIRDAVASISTPVIEVHLSNIGAREAFRQQSLIAPVCLGSISGFGWVSYLLGIRALAEFLKSDKKEID